MAALIQQTAEQGTGQRTRTYDIVALHVPIAYNAFGDYDSNGALYALAEDAEQLRSIAASWPNPFPNYLKEPDRVPRPHPLMRPLVLRVRCGELLRVRLTNELSRPAGITMQGVRYDARMSDGLAVGANPDTSVLPGHNREYEWLCLHEGVFHFGDMADARGEGAQSHGLIGALVVEASDATWTDPETGGALASGLYADVHLPGCSFREYVIFMMEYPSNDNPANLATVMPGMPGMPGMPVGSLPSSPLQARAARDVDAHAADTMADLTPPNNAMLPVNLRIEPMEWRQYRYQRMLEQGALDPVRDAQTGEEMHHSSWMFGDPATPVLRGYQGDPAVVRLVHGGMRDTHVFHTHLHQWRVNPYDENSPIVDSVSISPQEGLTLELIGGLGSVQQAVGDAIWHCHMYVHFHMGMWGLFRMFDTLQDGSGTYPDGTPIRALIPLPHRDSPPRPTPARPGFPAFMAQSATYPCKSPRPPRTPHQPAGMGREPTPLEEAAFCADPQPGEAFTKISPPDAPVRRYHLVAASGTVYYYGDVTGQDATWHDHRGMFFVLAEEIEAVGGLAEFQRQLEIGESTIEPLVIRARKGEVLELTLTNALPSGPQEQTAFDPALPFQPECGLHTHLVKYDPLVSDGASVGWNYLSGTTTSDQGADAFARYNSWTYRWHVDEEFGAVFFHDHLLANYRQRHGLFGAMIAEPECANWVSPADHTRVLSHGSQAVIIQPNGQDYRELILAVADFVPLVEHTRTGTGMQEAPINPPPVPGSPDDQGVMGVNYRCEPLSERGGDPADWFASSIHKDPRTPILRSYPGEPIRVHLVQGSHDLQHSFTINGMRWRQWSDRPDLPWRDQQTLGISNVAELRLDGSYGSGDYLWSFCATDDLWLGCWGLLRLHDQPQRDLPVLPGAVQRRDPLPPKHLVRRYTVRARARGIVYSDRRVDPYGLCYVVDGEPVEGPLVLRCRTGEWVEVTLINELEAAPPASAFDPPLMAKDDPGSRVLSGRVSLHPTLLRYNVCADDGTNVGYNEDSTVNPGGSRTYYWYADQPGVVLLRDHADVVSHMRRGLVGTLVVEAADATPYDPETGRERWIGEQAVVRRLDAETVRELVLISQDGLRLYHDGDLTQPVSDLFSDSKDDAGQKAYNYRTAALHPLRPVLTDPAPPTPLLRCRAGDQVTIHLAIGGSRSRNQCFTVHGQVWDVSEVGHGPYVSTIGALAAGSTRTVRFRASYPGDYAYRTGNLHWGLSEGWWGLIRVQEAP